MRCRVRTSHKGIAFKLSAPRLESEPISECGEGTLSGYMDRLSSVIILPRAGRWCRASVQSYEVLCSHEPMTIIVGRAVVELYACKVWLTESSTVKLEKASLSKSTPCPALSEAMCGCLFAWQAFAASATISLDGSTCQVQTSGLKLFQVDQRRRQA